MATVDAIKKLHTSMIDTRRAYEKALEEAEEPALKSLFVDMVAMRRKDHNELHHVLTEMGEKPNEDGSFHDDSPQSRDCGAVGREGRR